MRSLPVYPHYSWRALTVGLSGCLTLCLDLYSTDQMVIAMASHRPAICAYFDWLTRLATTSVPHLREFPQVDQALMDRVEAAVVRSAQDGFWGTRFISRLLVRYLGAWGEHDPATVQLPLLTSVCRLCMAMGTPLWSTRTTAWSCVEHWSSSPTAV